MPTVPFILRRAAFRGLLERPRVIEHAPVWDPISARLAESLGFEIGMLPGSIASHTILGAPDIVLMTLSEFVEQARRITRATSFPLLVDADHGYGNALNVARTVEELEAAGVAGLTIEDTVLPRRYGGPEGELISVEEYRDKLRAAVAARSDHSLVIVGRTGALTRGYGLEEALLRVRAATEAGVDCIFVLATTEKQQVEAIRGATHLPVMLNTVAAPYEELAALGVRIVLQGQAPFFAAVRAVHEAYVALKEGAPPALSDRVAAREVQAAALANADYAALTKSYLGSE